MKTHPQRAEKVMAMPLRAPTLCGGTELFMRIPTAAKQVREQTLLTTMHRSRHTHNAVGLENKPNKRYTCSDHRRRSGYQMKLLSFERTDIYISCCRLILLI